MGMHRQLAIGVALAICCSAQGQNIAPAAGGTGSIEGTILAAEQAPAQPGSGPLQGIAVNVEKRSPTGIWTRFGGAAHTDAHGHYSLQGLPPGQYVVFAAFPGNWVNSGGARIAADGPILFAPGTPRVAKAKILEITGDTHLDHIDLQVPPDSRHHITGTVTDTQGRPVTRGLVRLFPSGERGLSRAAPLDDDGHFDFDQLSPEQYIVLASHNGDIRPGPGNTSVEVTVQGPTDPLPLHLHLP